MGSEIKPYAFFPVVLDGGM